MRVRIDIFFSLRHNCSMIQQSNPQKTGALGIQLLERILSGIGLAKNIFIQKQYLL